jgi:hypothetical protein
VAGAGPNGAANTSNNDHGHLVTRSDQCATGVVPTYQNLGFLAWDPAQILTPPGEGALGSITTPGLEPRHPAGALSSAPSHRPSARPSYRQK